MALIKYISFNTLLSFVSVVINFFIITFLTHIYPKMDLVIYTVIIDAMNICSFFAAGFQDSLVRLFNVTEQRQQAARGMFISMGILWLIEAVFLLPYLQYFYLPTELTHYDYGLWQVELLLLLMTLNQALVYLFVANRIYGVVSVTEIVRSFLYLTAFIVFYFTVPLNSGHQYLIVATTVMNLLYFIWLYRMLVKKLPAYRFKTWIPAFTGATPKFVEKKLFQKYALLSSLENICSYFYLYISGFIILMSYSTNELADFQIVARPIYMALLTVTSFPIMRFMLPEFAALIADRNWQKIFSIRKQFIKILSLLGIIGIVGCWITSHFFVKLFFPEKYLGAVIMLNILIIAIPFTIYTAAAFSLIKANGGFLQTFWIRIFGVIAFLVFTVFFRHFYVSVLAIIYAMTLSVISMFLHASMIERKILASFNANPLAEKLT